MDNKPLVRQQLDDVAVDLMPNVDLPTRKQVVSDLTDFVYDAMVKFNAGQKEHGGVLEERDVLTDMRFEIIDSFFYNQAAKRKYKA